jgi:hypothetical protein
MGGLFDVLTLVSPRRALQLRLCMPLVKLASSGAWLWPLLGITSLPSTTWMYALVVGLRGSTNFWGRLMLLFGLLMDLRGYLGARANRRRLAASQTR